MQVKATSAKAEEVLRALVELSPIEFQQLEEKTVPTVPPVTQEYQMPKIDITEFDSPNQNARNATISAIVLHNTCGSFDGAVSWLCNPAARTSAHLVISRDGRTACLVDFSKRAWHAGSSEWNACSIGIELEAYEGAEGLMPAQEAKLVIWLRWMMQKYSVKADRIKLHRNVCETSCPGFIWETDEEFLTWRKHHFDV